MQATATATMQAPATTAVPVSALVAVQAAVLAAVLAAIQATGLAPAQATATASVHATAIAAVTVFSPAGVLARRTAAAFGLTAAPTSVPSSSLPMETRRLRGLTGIEFRCPHHSPASRRPGRADARTRIRPQQCARAARHLDAGDAASDPRFGAHPSLPCPIARQPATGTCTPARSEEPVQEKT